VTAPNIENRAHLNPARGSPCRRRAWARTRWTSAA
jgi:hypothetical protein